MSDEISTKQFIKELNRMIERMGGIPGAARYWGLSESFIRSVRSGVHLPGKTILKTMDLYPIKEIKYTYRRVEHN
jgi:hypothetical protein